MKRLPQLKLSVLCACGSIIAISGCGEQEGAEKAGKTVDQAMGKITEALQETMRKTGTAINDASEKTGQALTEAVEGKEKIGEGSTKHQGTFSILH